MCDLTYHREHILPAAGCPLLGAHANPIPAHGVGLTLVAAGDSSRPTMLVGGEGEEGQRLAAAWPWVLQPGSCCSLAGQAQRALSPCGRYRSWNCRFNWGFQSKTNLKHIIFFFKSHADFLHCSGSSRQAAPPRAIGCPALPSSGSPAGAYRRQARGSRGTGPSGAGGGPGGALLQQRGRGGVGAARGLGGARGDGKLWWHGYSKLVLVAALSPPWGLVGLGSEHRFQGSFNHLPLRCPERRVATENLGVHRLPCNEPAGSWG